MKLGSPKVLVRLEVPLDTYMCLMESKPENQSRNAYFMALIEEAKDAREPREEGHECKSGELRVGAE